MKLKPTSIKVISFEQNLGVEYAIKEYTHVKSIEQLDDIENTDIIFILADKDLSHKHPEKRFLIVRGYLHKNLSNLLSNSGFKVKDYTYGE